MRVAPNLDSNTLFLKLLDEQIDILEYELLQKSAQYESWGIKTEEELLSYFQSFRKLAKDTSCDVNEDGTKSLHLQLRSAFTQGNLYKLRDDLKHRFMDSVITPRFSRKEKHLQIRTADLKHPIDWYPATRALQREVHLHVGPTNSGKTYHALKRLEEAKTGIYAGPLRLLAHEVYTRFNAKGKACALVTGEERRVPDGMTHVMNSCTVEMVPLNAAVDVAVIDEIQMMADVERGWAWTQAFLGVQAKEVHLCGELRTIELVTSLCKALGDKLIIHKYERLSQLQTLNSSLHGDLSKLQKGDAMILFSRLAIHAMKGDIELATGKRCAVVYGSLPPETRAQQAALFNDPDNEYDFLVASDAVGMGLNLSIKRIIFEATSKHDGTQHRVMAASDIKQIAGRAGRFKTASDAIKKSTIDLTDGAEPAQAEMVEKPAPNIGYVTTLEPFDLPILQKAMNADVEPLATAGIFPPTTVILRFASYFPRGTPFSYILLRLHEIAPLGDLFHLCNLKEQLRVADAIETLPLSPMDRINFIAAPVPIRDPEAPNVLRELAACVAFQGNGELVNIKSINLELLGEDRTKYVFGEKHYLRALESLHKSITLYLWLSYRFPGTFRSQALAFHTKGLVETRIDDCLAQTNFDSASRKKNLAQRQQKVQQHLERIEIQKQIQEKAIASTATDEGGLQHKDTFNGEDEPSIPTEGVSQQKSAMTGQGERLEHILSSYPPNGGSGAGTQSDLNAQTS